jgi:hypothetical protein
VPKKSSSGVIFKNKLKKVKIKKMSVMHEGAFLKHRFPLLGI